MKRLKNLSNLPSWTAFNSAVFAIPSSDTETSAIFALTMFVTPWITEFGIAKFASPALFTTAGLTYATTMRSTLQIAKLLRAVVSTPLRFTDARLTVQLKSTMSRAIWQALKSILIHSTAIWTFPALLTYTSTLSAESMAVAGRMGTIN